MKNLSNIKGGGGGHLKLDRPPQLLQLILDLRNRQLQRAPPVRTRGLLREAPLPLHLQRLHPALALGLRPPRLRVLIADIRHSHLRCYCFPNRYTIPAFTPRLLWNALPPVALLNVVPMNVGVTRNARFG